MLVESLEIIDFRNYKNLSLDFDKNVNMIIGQNGQGKTNIVEAIHFLSFAKSFRTNRDREVINFDSDSAFIKAVIENSSGKENIDIKLSHGKKGINVNSIPIEKIGELIGILNVVVFSPEDVKIVSDSPVYRRMFMDKEISQIKPYYYNMLLDYNKTLENKNAHLKSKSIDPIMLDIYDEQLAGCMENIINYRQDFIDKISPIASRAHHSISSQKEELNILYKKNISSAKKEDIIEELKSVRQNDIIQGTSSKGIHKDDIVLKLSDMDIRKFGSQGQKKTATIALKLSEIDLIYEMKKEYPVVILDDIFSELDIQRRKTIVEKLYNIQTFITTTEKIELEKEIKYFLVKDKKVSEI